MKFFLKSKWIILGGFIFGVLGALAVNCGNPLNMGICVACFLRDIAGALKYHSAAAVQYLRPEIMGIVLGALGSSMIFKEFRPRGGSSPIVRFILGMCVIVGTMVFLGCPTRMTLRLGGGDMSALIGVAGLVVGVLIGVFFLRQGFSLGRAKKMPKAVGYIMPLLMMALLVLLFIKSGALSFSETGPGSQHVNPWLGLGLGLVVGCIVQRTRFCSIGGFRDIFLTRDFYLFAGFVAFLAGVVVANLVAGNFGVGGLVISGIDVNYNVGFFNQPIALPYENTDGIIWSQIVWSFLGFVLVGLAASQMGGCPLRTTVLAGEGDTDAGIGVLGYIAGGALAMNFAIASSAGAAGAIGQNAPIAVIIGLVFCIGIGFTMREDTA
ncbi:MAG: YedE family putative selenium transporter [Dehalococcoidia bacterium]|nr:YedE family putative selenium transporter [Dehalococcoidia bacterium]